MLRVRGAGLLAALCGVLVLHGVGALRHARVSSPLAAARGANVELRCEYDLEADALYSVKWYRGDREFCRYSPREEPPLKVFRLPGIHVDVSASDAERLTLRAVSRGAAGRYTCEVSADAPSFHTALVNTTLAVVDVPQVGPTLRGVRARYRPGVVLHADCVCRDSLPPANLTFFINGVLASAKYVRHRVESGAGELVSAASSLRFLVHAHHFIGGKMKVRCTASIYTVYWQSTEKSTVEERPQEAAGEADSQRVALVFPVHGQPPPLTTAGDAGEGTSQGADHRAPSTVLLMVALVCSSYNRLLVSR